MQAVFEKIKDKLIQHAVEESPKECCGLLMVINGKLEYKKCRNIADIGDFVIDPSDYAKYCDLGEVVAIFHSHNTGDSEPSVCDKLCIEKGKIPWIIYDIVSDSFTETKPTGFKLPILGREFKHGFVDCLSLIRDYYSEIGIILPDSEREDDWWLKGGNLYNDKFESFGFVKVGGSEFTDFKKHDVILMQVGSPVPNHGAVYIGDNQIIQHCQGRLSSKDVYGGYWRKVTNSVIRHKEFL